MVYTRPPGKFQRAYKRKQYGLPILNFELCASHRSLLFFKVSRKEPSGQQLFVPPDGFSPERSSGIPQSLDCCEAEDTQGSYRILTLPKYKLNIPLGALKVF